MNQNVFKYGTLWGAAPKENFAIHFSISLSKGSTSKVPQTYLSPQIHSG